MSKIWIALCQLFSCVYGGGGGWVRRELKTSNKLTGVHNKTTKESLQPLQKII